LLDRLEQLIKDGQRLPFGKRIAVDGEAFRKVLAQMWVVVPQRLKEVRDLDLDRDRLLTRAQDEAETIISQAREQAARLLDEHAIRAQAQAYAKDVIKQSDHAAARTRAEADDYASSSLQALAEQVDRLREVIGNGIAALEAHRREQSALAYSLDGETPPPADGTPPEDEGSSFVDDAATDLS
jgi:vacuolar-type H+-ATPase subunit H